MNIIKLIKSSLQYYYNFSKVCYFGFTLNLLESIFIGIYYYLTIYFVDTLHFDIRTAGVIISCYGIGAIIGGFVGGKLSDQWTPGIVATCSLFLQAIIYFVFVHVQSVNLLMMTVFILGIASYGFITANHLFVLGNCIKGDTERLRAISVLSMTSNLGLGLSALLLGAVLSFGFHSVFLIISLLMFILACTSLYYEINMRKINSNILSSQPNDTQIKQGNHPEKANLSIFLMALSSVFFIGLIVAQLGATYTLYIKEVYPSYGIQGVTTLFAINSFIVVIASSLVCELIKEYNKIIMVGLGGFLIGFGMFLLVFSNWFGMAVLSCVVYTFGEIIFFSMVQLLCYECGFENKKGSSLGIYRVVYASTRVLGPAAGGCIYSQFGGNMLWIISGIFGAACLLCCYLLYILRYTRNASILEV